MFVCLVVCLLSLFLPLRFRQPRGCSSVVERVLSMHEAPGSIPGTSSLEAALLSLWRAQEEGPFPTPEEKAQAFLSSNSILFYYALAMP